MPTTRYAYNVVLSYFQKTKDTTNFMKYYLESRERNVTLDDAFLSMLPSVFVSPLHRTMLATVSTLLILHSMLWILEDFKGHQPDLLATACLVQALVQVGDYDSAKLLLQVLATKDIKRRSEVQYLICNTSGQRGHDITIWNGVNSAEQLAR